jgi:hypothetical protein
MTPLLHDKNAVAYGSGGAIGGAVARAFAGQVRSTGGLAGAAVIGVFDKRRDEGSTSA